MVKTAYFLLTYDCPRDGEYSPMRTAIAKLSENRAHELSPQTTFMFQVDAFSYKDATKNTVREISKYLDEEHGNAVLVCLSTGSIRERKMGQPWKLIHASADPFKDWDTFEPKLGETLEKLMKDWEDEQVYD